MAVSAAGKDSHGHGAHEFRAGCHLLAKKLNESGLGIKATVVEERNWPKEKIFQKVAPLLRPRAKKK